MAGSPAQGPRARHRNPPRWDAVLEGQHMSARTLTAARSDQPQSNSGNTCVPPNWRSIGRVVEDVIEKVAAQHGRAGGRLFHAPKAAQSRATQSHD